MTNKEVPYIQIIVLLSTILIVSVIFLFWLDYDLKQKEDREKTIIINHYLENAKPYQDNITDCFSWWNKENSSNSYIFCREDSSEDIYYLIYDKNGKRINHNGK